MPKGDEVVQECEIGLVRIRRGLGRLSFAAPKMRRTGALEPDILARVIEGLRLAFINWIVRPTHCGEAFDPRLGERLPLQGEAGAEPILAARRRACGG